MQRVSISLCALASLASLALLSGCADLARPEQITVAAEKPASAPAPTAAAAAAAAILPGIGGASPPARAGGG